jgi:hypothetical protein
MTDPRSRLARVAGHKFRGRAAGGASRWNTVWRPAISAFAADAIAELEALIERCRNRELCPDPRPTGFGIRS